MNHAFASHCMQRCLQLAALGRKRVGNGALVGSVLARNGKIIAEGFHRGFGEYHAERELLQNFDQKIQQEDVLFVNLEPCCHTGKTPPCTDVILERGIRKVVYGMADPDSRIAGKGIKILRDKRIEVIGPVERTACEYMNRGFRTVRTKNRPWITVKMAKNRAGSISNADGSPLKITNQKQDIWSHTYLRGQLDGVVVGAHTVFSDDPKLNTRFTQENYIESSSALFKDEKRLNIKVEQEQPWRIILDPNFRIPRTAKILNDELSSKTILILESQIVIQGSDRELLERQNVQVRGVSRRGGDFVWQELWDALMTPINGYPGLTSLLIEGGQKTWEAFRRSGCIDEEVSLVGQQ